MASSYLILPPATPSDLISHIISEYRHPSTLLIGTSRDLFLQSLDRDIDSRAPPLSSRQQQQDAAEEIGGETEPLIYGRGDSELLRPTLLQIAVSRHIRTVFIPTVAHLRAYLSVFSQDDSTIPAPPVQHQHPQQLDGGPPALLVYGFLELHRTTSEWSAQGLASSASILVEAAVRNGLRAAVVDPAGGGGYDTLDNMMSEGVPLLSGTMARHSGSWSGRTVEVRRVLGRWFRSSS